MTGKNKPKFLEHIIDLTPLLDVIFILLIVVLCYQDSYLKKADEKVADAERTEQTAKEEAAETEKSAKDAIAETEGRYEAAREQLSTYEQIYDYVNVVSVYASYRPSNRKYRTLHVEINANGPWEKEINPSNEDRIWDECLAYIEDTLKDSACPTVFAIRNEKMLYRDEQAILELYDRLNIKDKYEKNYTETDDE